VQLCLRGAPTNQIINTLLERSANQPIRTSIHVTFILTCVRHLPTACGVDAKRIVKVTTVIHLASCFCSFDKMKTDGLWPRMLPLCPWPSVIRSMMYYIITEGGAMNKANFMNVIYYDKSRRNKRLQQSNVNHLKLIITVKMS
jgi:hypothetical protein